MYCTISNVQKCTCRPENVVFLILISGKAHSLQFTVYTLFPPFITFYCWPLCLCFILCICICCRLLVILFNVSHVVSFCCKAHYTAVKKGAIKINFTVSDITFWRFLWFKLYYNVNQIKPISQQLRREISKKYIFVLIPYNLTCCGTKRPLHQTLHVVIYFIFCV